MDSPRCFVCKREGPILDGTYTRVDFRGQIGIQLVCDDCAVKADPEPREVVVEDHGAYIVTIDDADWTEPELREAWGR